MSTEERVAIDVAFVLETDGDIVAVMPGLAGTVNRPDTCSCYAHMGQHSAGNIDYFVNHCSRAHPDWYADLLKELVRIGYDVTVIPFDDINDDEYLAARIKELEIR